MCSSFYFSLSLALARARFSARENNDDRSLLSKTEEREIPVSFLDVCKTQLENRNDTRYRGKKEAEREREKTLRSEGKKETNPPIIINDYCIRFNNGPLGTARLHCEFSLSLPPFSILSIGFLFLTSSSPL